MNTTSKIKKIPPLRQAFIKHLLADPEMCATRAYKAAGYQYKNDQVARREACRLLTIPYIIEAIEVEKAKRAKRLRASIDKTLLKLMRGQEFDIRRMYKLAEDGKSIQLKTPLELDDDTAAAVVGIKYKDGVIEEYKIIDVKACTQLVGEHLGMFRQKIELTGKDGAALQHFSDLELANRVATLLMKAKKTKKEAAK
jgi:phage terminase small subunit